MIPLLIKISFRLHPLSRIFYNYFGRLEAHHRQKPLPVHLKFSKKGEERHKEVKSEKEIIRTQRFQDGG